MSEIKPWDEMLDSQTADGQVVTTMDIRESMQVEINKLRVALADRDAKLAALEKQEPVMIYEGRCVIDCGDSGHQDVTMLKMIPEGSPVYAAAGAAGAAPVPKGWISVTDRLPETDDPVLVWNVNGRHDIDVWQEIWEDPIGMGGKDVCVGEGWNDHDYEDITHWMPLPTAPKEQP